MKFTAPDQEPHLINRLEHVLTYVTALADYHGNVFVHDKLDGLHDEQGKLTVHWCIQPTSEEKEFFLRAWLSSVGDGDDNVHHIEL